MSDVNIARIKPLNQTELLIATEGMGIHKINMNSCISEPYIVSSYKSHNEMNSNNINDIYIDEEKRMLSSFCYNYPDISVNILQDGTHRLVDLLLERKIDLGFLNRPLTELPSSLDFAKLGEDYYSLAVPSLHPLAKRGIVSLSELKDEHFIFHQSAII